MTKTGHNDRLMRLRTVAHKKKTSSQHLREIQDNKKICLEIKKEREAEKMMNNFLYATYIKPQKKPGRQEPLWTILN